MIEYNFQNFNKFWILRNKEILRGFVGQEKIREVLKKLNERDF